MRTHRATDENRSKLAHVVVVGRADRWRPITELRRGGADNDARRGALHSHLKNGIDDFSFHFYFYKNFSLFIRV